MAGLAEKKGCRRREVFCKTVLNRSGIADYAVNCYAGCEHGCVYCYARFATRFSHPEEEWGEFVDIKVNAPVILRLEAARKRVGQVMVSSVCDGWQPVESAYGLTRQCLEILLHYGYPVSILSKSSLAGRDLDILASAREKVELGMTITTLDEALRRVIEPASSPAPERLAVLQEAKRRGLTTFAFFGPLLPGLSDTVENLEALLAAAKEVDVDYFFIDRLNRRFGVWRAFRRLLQVQLPSLLETYRQLFFNDIYRERYLAQLAVTIRQLVRKHGLDDRMRLCF